MDSFGYSREFSWSRALRVCYRFGGDLVSVANKKEMDFVYSLSPKITAKSPAWIGLVYQFQKNEYLWSNGESFNGSFSVNSLEYYMNSTVRQDKCGEIFRNDLNLTKCCKKNKYFICERAKGKLFLRKHLIRKKLRIGGVCVFELKTSHKLQLQTSEEYRTVCKQTQGYK